jgi:glyceraldehyde-3-phosphate dehydrogenase (NAD(P)+) (phosphorylating)
MLQPDLRLAGVLEDDPLRQQVLQARRIAGVAGDVPGWAASCEVLVVCHAEAPKFTRPAVYAPQIGADCPLFVLDCQASKSQRLRVPCADAIAFQRLLGQLPPARRLFSSCARRTEDAGRPGFGCVDALTPVFELPAEDADLRQALGSLVGSVFVRRTELPYTHSHVHHVKLDLKSVLTREEALKALRAGPRMRVASGAAGFSDTGHVQEFDRDVGRIRGDRPEIFIWEESVAVVNQSLFLTVDVDPDATPIPEMIDAVRRLARPELPFAEVCRLTDETLAPGGAR